MATQAEEVGKSTSTASWVSINSSTAECSWAFNAVPIAASDRLVLEVYAVDASGVAISKAFTSYGAAAAQGSTEGVLIKPEGTLTWRNYSRLMMFLDVFYTDGVSVGRIELASKKHFDSLTADLAATGEQVYRDAQAVQDIADGLSMTVGMVTTRAPGSQAAATLVPGSTLGAHVLNMSIPRGDMGLVDTNQQPQTYAATLNANGGINIPVAPSTDTEAVRYKELRLFQEMEFSAVKTYFRYPNPFSWDTLVDRSTWVASGEITNFTVAKGEFTLFSRDYLNRSYNNLTSCFIPISCGLARG